MPDLIVQIPQLVNDAFNDAIGTNATLTELDTSDIVSMGKALREFNLYEGFFGSLANRIVNTRYMKRAYERTDRKILRDEHEYGAFVQRVYIDSPDATDNPAFNYNDQGKFEQKSPYELDATADFTVSAKIFGGQGTWTLEYRRPMVQIATAFTSLSAMNAFIDSLYLEADNKFKLEEERIEAAAANTGMAVALTNGQSKNLLAAYNAAHPNNILTVAQAMESADFLKYASMEISTTIDNMKNMSTVFNAAKYKTYTNRDNLIVEILTRFAKASDMYLQADTFHNELVALPNYTTVNYWQGSGSNFAFDDVSKINIKHDDLVTEDNQTGTVNQGGIICFLHDIEYVAAYFGERYSWEEVNRRSRIVNHGEQLRKGYAVDNHMNAFVFYIA